MEMNNRLINLTCSAVVGMALCSCSADGGGDAMAVPSDLQPFTLEVGMGSTQNTAQAATRAATDIHTWGFEVGEEFKASFADGVLNADKSALNATNYTVTGVGNGFNDVKPAVATYVKQGEVVEVTATYPAAGDQGIQADQSTKEGFRQSDYMVGKGKINGQTTAWTGTIDGHTGDVTLLPGQGHIFFVHQNAKVVVNAIAKSDLKITKIVIQGSTAVTMYSNTPGEAIVHTAAILQPGTLAAGDLLEVVTDKGTVIYKLATSKALAMNTVYTLNIDVAHEHNIVTIQDWDNVVQAVGNPQWQD